MAQGIVEKVVFGGKGLLRHEGLVVFVDDVLPNEEIEFEITQKKKNFSVGKLKQCITTSPDRITALCPHFGSCGGCQLQHIRYEKQLELKREWLFETLMRIGRLQIDVAITLHAASRPYGYRNKIILHAKNGKIGFVNRSQELFDVQCCPIFIENETELFALLHKAGIVDATISVFKQPKAVHIKYEGALPKEAALQYKMLSEHGYAVQIEARNKTIGDELVLDITVDGIMCSFCPKVFIQNAPEQFSRVYKTVLGKIEGLGYRGPILDLYCGIGILSLLLAKRGYKVTGIELNDKAVEYAKGALKKNGVQNARFFSAASESCMRYGDNENWGVWIVNPPRTGLSDQMKQEILKAMPEHVFYISCEPSTLARDLSLLCQKYSVESLDLFDMFSQTTHFETAVYLRKQ